MLNVSQNQPRIRALRQDERYGKFAIEPLDKGYGHTLGASLRRVLLSSIEGVAITAVQVRVDLDFRRSLAGREDNVERLRIIRRLVDEHVRSGVVRVHPIHGQDGIAGNAVREGERHVVRGRVVLGELLLVVARVPEADPVFDRRTERGRA